MNDEKKHRIIAMLVKAKLDLDYVGKELYAQNNNLTSLVWAASIVLLEVIDKLNKEGDK